MPQKRIVTFSLKKSLPEEAMQSILESIRAIQGIEVVSKLRPNATDDDIRGLCYAYIKDDADIGQILKEMSALDNVQDCSIPPRRSLIQ